MKTFLNIILIGLLTTLSRIIAQFFIPSTESVLKPSTFAEKGIMQVAFIIYGIIAYSVIASMYLLIEKKIKGKRIIKGLKYGLSCVAIWGIYLLEPLPHVKPLDMIAYPIADGIALMIMGLLLGVLLTKDNQKENSNTVHKKATWLDYLSITATFICGRLILHYAFDIYSGIETKEFQTIVWTALTGFVIAVVVLWFQKHMHSFKIKGVFLTGIVLFGVNLILFNFFMPLVFEVDIIYLIIRILVDVLSVTIGLLLVPVKIRPKKNKYIWFIDVTGRKA